jgi:hypothetical protein
MDAKGPTVPALEVKVESFDPPSENAEDPTSHGTYKKPTLSRTRSTALALVLASSPFLTVGSLREWIPAICRL